MIQFLPRPLSLLAQELALQDDIEPSLNVLEFVGKLVDDCDVLLDIEDCGLLLEILFDSFNFRSQLVVCLLLLGQLVLETSFT